MVEQIIFDWKRTLYDPESRVLMQNTQAVLTALIDRNITLILIGKGGADMDEALDGLDARRFFTATHFVPAKSNTLFSKYISENDPQDTLVVGDRAQGEIAIAKSLGAKAIWLRTGKFSNELPLVDIPPPDDIINEIGDLLNSALLDA